jgi:ornithine cyclodeaminase/alanine dehydrogenase-like protein (mu-crystallin family)
MLVLTRSQVEALLDAKALVDALAVAMDDLSAGRASVPKRNFAVAGSAGLLAAMPGYLPTQDVLAAKLVLVFPGNASKGIETHQAVIGVFDPKSGVPVALMDGAAITATRTAAGSALATHLCARRDARVLAIIGTGVQARSHARVLPAVREIAEIVVAGRSPAKVAAFAAEIGARTAPTYKEAVAGADIVCCCTHATEPVLHREWLRPGTHVNSVGLTRGPELDPAVFGGAVVVVESRAAAIGTFPDGATDITAAVEEGLVRVEDIREVGELVAGRRTGRTGGEEITVYRSVGVAAQDAAAAGLVLDAARARGVGTEVEL